MRQPPYCCRWIGRKQCRKFYLSGRTEWEALCIGGEVPINIPYGKNAQESIIVIAKEVQAAALAPANPSPQDFKVVASAAMMEARARQELALEKANAGKSNMNLADLYDNTMVATNTVGDGLDIHI